jgi:hypothetical protein
MEELKDLLALYGTGSLSRQVNVQVRREAAGCLTGLINLALVGCGLILLALFIGAIGGVSQVYRPQEQVTPRATLDYTPEATSRAYDPGFAGQVSGRPDRDGSASPAQPTPTSSPTTSSTEMPVIASATPTPQPTPLPTPDSRRKNWPDGRILIHPEAFRADLRS